MDGLMVNVWLGDPDELANQVSNIITLSGVRLGDIIAHLYGQKCGKELETYLENYSNNASYILKATQNKLIQYMLKVWKYRAESIK